MTTLEESLLRKLRKIQDTDILNLCLDGAQVRANRPMSDADRIDMAYEFFCEIDELHDTACMKPKLNLFQRFICLFKMERS